MPSEIEPHAPFPRVARSRRPARVPSLLGALGVASPWPPPVQVPRLTVIGAGAGASCAAWVAAARSNATLEQCAFGFANTTVANAQLQLGTDPLASLDADAIHTWLGDYFRQRLGTHSESVE